MSSKAFGTQKSKEQAEVDEIIGQLDAPPADASMDPSVEARKDKATELEIKVRQQKHGKRHLVAKSTGASLQFNPKKEAALTKNSRKPRNLLGRGLPKKGGAGGKTVWGRPEDELKALEDLQNETIDEPEFDASLAEGDITKPEQVRAVLTPLLNEYYNHANAAEVIRSLETLPVVTDVVYMFAYTPVIISLDKSNAERELTSVLLAEMYDKILIEEHYEAAFEKLLKEVDDLVLDYPEITEMLSCFIARCIADDCLVPKFVYSRQEKEHSELAGQILTKAAALINMNHGMVHLDNIWGVSGGIRPVKHLIKQMHNILKEYVDSSGDVMEAIRRLEELRVPHFHHEFVYEACLLAMEDTSERAFDLVLKLLKEGSSELVLTLDQLETGFQRVFDDLDDIVLDVPMAQTLFERLTSKCVELGIISQEFLKKLPTRGRKRYASENDGGRFKEDGAGDRATAGSLPEEEDE